MPQTQATISEVINDPHWFPFSFDQEYRHLTFVKTDAQTLRDAPFLDGRFITKNVARQTVPIDLLLSELPVSRNLPPPMIFHSAFCCSTLMAKALDKPGLCLSLKEPEIIMSLANAKRMLPRANRPGEDFKQMYELVMHLLARRFSSEEIVMIKPTNSANNLLEDAVVCNAPIVLMFASLEDFLVSVLKKGEACRSFIRTQFNIFTLDPCAMADIPPRQAFTFTDLQIATLVWRHQLELFYHVQLSYKGNVATIRDKNFLSDLHTHAQLASTTLGLKHSSEQLQTIVSGELFNRNVKHDGQKMNAEQRSSQAMEIKKKYSSELNDTLNWAKNVKFNNGVLN